MALITSCLDIVFYRCVGAMMANVVHKFEESVAEFGVLGVVCFL
jgi:hypothetical protein